APLTIVSIEHPTRLRIGRKNITRELKCARTIRQAPVQLNESRSVTDSLVHNKTQFFQNRHVRKVAQMNIAKDGLSSILKHAYSTGDKISRDGRCSKIHKLLVLSAACSVAQRSQCDISVLLTSMCHDNTANFQTIKTCYKATSQL